MNELDLEERLEALENTVSKLIGHIGDLADRVTSLAESGSNVTGHVTTVVYETAALSQYLLLFGDFLEKVTKVLPPGSMAKVYDAVTENMEPDVRSGAHRIVYNLSHWKRQG